MTPVGLEPTIPGSVGRCLIHWATGPSARCEELLPDAEAKSRAQLLMLAGMITTSGRETDGPRASKLKKNCG